MLSPQDVESYFVLQEKRVIKFFSSLPRSWFPPLAMGIMGAIYYFIIYPMAADYSPLQLNLRAYNERRWMFFPIGLMGLLYPYISSRLLLPLNILFVFTTWFLVCFINQSQSVLAYLSFPTLMILSLFLLRFDLFKWVTRWIKILMIILIFISVGYYLAINALKTQNSGVLSLFWIVHPQFYLLFLFSWIMIKKTGPSTWLSISPINLTWGTLWPEETTLLIGSKEDRWKNWNHGLYNCLVGSFFYLIVFGSKVLVKNASWNEIYLTSYYYIYFLLFIVGTFNMFIGLARMIGIHCPDPTNFLLLAKSPLEVWQRGSVYLYKFFLRYIFIPLYRNLKNYLLTMLISLLLVITHMFLFHDIFVVKLFMLMIPEMKAPGFSFFPTLLFSVSWGAIWFIWIILAATVWQKHLVKASSPFLVWLSILLNHIIVASIYPSANYIVVTVLRYLQG
jgi:hypothetical protein